MGRENLWVKWPRKDLRKFWGKLKNFRKKSKRGGLGGEERGGGFWGDFLRKIHKRNFIKNGWILFPILD